jgi:ketosteroid isomerase-like protein
MATARTILSSQSYEITSAIESGSTVAIETLWKGVMAIDAGPLKKGQEMKAFICMFFEFREGKIHRVRNYDCFEPLQ